MKSPPKFGSRSYVYLAVALFLAFFWGGLAGKAFGQITDEVQVVNGDFEDDNGACTNYIITNSNTCYDAATNGIPGIGYVLWIRQHDVEFVSLNTFIQSSISDAEILTSSQFVFPAVIHRRQSGFAFHQLCVDFFDAFGDPLTTHCAPETGFQNHPGNAPDPYTLTITGDTPDLARQFRIRFYDDSGGDRLVIDSFGPMSITYIPDDEEEETPVNVDVDVVVDGDFDVDPQDIQDALNYATNLQSALCESIPDLSGLAFVPDAWGGAGIGGQIAQIQQGIKDACLQESQVTSQTEISDGINNPDSLPNIPDPAAYDDPQSADISDRLNSAFGSAVYQDNTVTAVNRQNDLLVYQTRVMVAQQERIYGKRDDPAAAISYEAPLISELDVEDDPSLAFAEGNYDQVKTKLTDETAPPDLPTSVMLSATLTAPVGGGSCLMTQETAPPDNYDSLTAAWDIIRWNASVRIAETSIGSLACELANQPERSVTDVCYGDLGYGDELCVYGGTAMPVVTSTLDLFPAILLILAGIVVLRLWFG